jgi:hypothetical protein
MVRAIGYSVDSFSPNDPGRLCRGRERWIESPVVPDAPEIDRVVVSGATFSDDSARDALRGLDHGGFDCAELLHALVAGRRVLAWCEDGHPRRVPAAAEQREDYSLYLPSGPRRRWCVRWAMDCKDVEDVRAALAGGADTFTVLPPTTDLLDPHPEFGVVFEALRRLVFYLTGYRQDGVPQRGFQAAALPDLLTVCDAVMLVHLDKHGPCLGVYSRDVEAVRDAVEDLLRGRGDLAVPFAIPPMLARWDRALWELRQDWNAAERGPFPVPAAPERGPSWLRRAHQRGWSSEEE